MAYNLGSATAIWKSRLIQCINGFDLRNNDDYDCDNGECYVTVSSGVQHVIESLRHSNQMTIWVVKPTSSMFGLGYVIRFRAIRTKVISETDESGHFVEICYVLSNKERNLLLKDIKVRLRFNLEPK